MFDFTFVRERERERWWNAARPCQSSIYSMTARACCWLVPSAIPRIHPSDGPCHTIMLLNKIVLFSSRTPNTTDFRHASRWPHPSPRLLLAGHKSRSQWEARDSQQFCAAMDRGGTFRDPLPLNLRPLATVRPRSVRVPDQLTGAKSYFDSSGPGGRQQSEHYASAKKVNLNRLHQQQQQQQCCVSSYSLAPAGAGRPAASPPVTDWQFRLQFISSLGCFILLNAIFIITQIFAFSCPVCSHGQWTSTKIVNSTKYILPDLFLWWFMQWFEWISVIQHKTVSEVP